MTNIEILESVWRRWRKPSRATLAAIGSQNATCEPGGEIKRRAQTLDSAVRQHIARLEADRAELLTMAKTIVRLRDMNVQPRPSSEIINALRETIATVERRKAASRLD